VVRQGHIAGARQKDHTASWRDHGKKERDIGEILKYVQRKTS
jgi:hypothetical protein